VTNAVILKDAYEATKSVWRPDMMAKVWIFYLIDLIAAFPFTYIFVKVAKAKGSWIQWFIDGWVQTVLLGIVAAAVYQLKTTDRRHIKLDRRVLTRASHTRTLGCNDPGALR
jgi:hypothetical protein